MSNFMPISLKQDLEFRQEKIRKGEPLDKSFQFLDPNTRKDYTRYIINVIRAKMFAVPNFMKDKKEDKQTYLGIRNAKPPAALWAGFNYIITNLNDTHLTWWKLHVDELLPYQLRAVRFLSILGAGMRDLDRFDSTNIEDLDKEFEDNIKLLNEEWVHILSSLEFAYHRPLTLNERKVVYLLKKDAEIYEEKTTDFERFLFIMSLFPGIANELDRDDVIVELFEREKNKYKFNTRSLPDNQRFLLGYQSYDPRIEKISIPRKVDPRTESKLRALEKNLEILKKKIDNDLINVIVVQNYEHVPNTRPFVAAMKELKKRRVQFDSHLQEYIKIHVLDIVGIGPLEVINRKILDLFNDIPKHLIRAHINVDKSGYSSMERILARGDKFLRAHLGKVGATILEGIADAFMGPSRILAGGLAFQGELMMTRKTNVEQGIQAIEDLIDQKFQDDAIILILYYSLLLNHRWSTVWLTDAEVREFADKLTQLLKNTFAIPGHELSEALAKKKLAAAFKEVPNAAKLLDSGTGKLVEKLIFGVVDTSSDVLSAIETASNAILFGLRHFEAILIIGGIVGLIYLIGPTVVDIVKFEEKK